MLALPPMTFKPRFLNVTDPVAGLSKADFNNGNRHHLAAYRGSIDATMFMLVVNGSVATKQFICKSDPAAPQASIFGNPHRARMFSISFQTLTTTQVSPGLQLFLGLPLGIGDGGWRVVEIEHRFV